MYEGLKILGIIPARGGSKGIPHKNIIDLCGRPLISYTIEAGLESKYMDYVMVSTDDEEIADVAKKCGAEVPFMRPAELATDTATTLDAILHALNTLKERGMDFDLLVLLQPTQPLRTADDIDRSIELCVSEGCLPLVSVSEVDDHPLLIRTISGNRLSKMLDVSSTCRRQDMPAYYRVNGCIYINRIDEIDETTSFNDNILPFVMERSHSVDIDELRDLAVAEYYLKERK
jgi:CMP-N-acetylneuraminic acid synthetase